MINASSARTGDLYMLSTAKIHTLFIFPNVKTKLFMIFLILLCYSYLAHEKPVVIIAEHLISGKQA